MIREYVKFKAEEEWLIESLEETKDFLYELKFDDVTAIENFSIFDTKDEFKKKSITKDMVINLFTEYEFDEEYFDVEDYFESSDFDGIKKDFSDEINKLNSYTDIDECITICFDKIHEIERELEYKRLCDDYYQEVEEDFIDQFLEACEEDITITSSKFSGTIPKPTSLEYTLNLEDGEMIIAYVEENTNLINYLRMTAECNLFEKQTPEICLLAVKKDWRALEFVEEQTSEICMVALEQNPEAIKYFKI